MLRRYPRSPSDQRRVFGSPNSDGIMIKRLILCAALLVPTLAHAQYYDGLPPASVVNPTDIIAICQGGTAGHPGTCSTAQTTVSAIQRLTPVTVSTLPPCTSSLAGSFSAVTDATSPTYNGALTGGGTVRIPVFCTGTSWTAH
jgi:hypothetical protein